MAAGCPRGKGGAVLPRRAGALAASGATHLPADSNRPARPAAGKSCSGRATRSPSRRKSTTTGRLIYKRDRDGRSRDSRVTQSFRSPLMTRAWPGQYSFFSHFSHFSLTALTHLSFLLSLFLTFLFILLSLSSGDEDDELPPELQWILPWVDRGIDMPEVEELCGAGSVAAQLEELACQEAPVLREGLSNLRTQILNLQVRDPFTLTLTFAHVHLTFCSI